MTTPSDQQKEKSKVRYALIRGLTPSRFITIILLSLLGLLWVGATIASAAAIDGVPGPATPAPIPSGNALTALPLGVVLVSFFVTGLGYGLNYVLPKIVSEPVKGVMQWVYQAIGVVGYQLAVGDGFGLNEQTLVAFVVAIGTYGLSHNFLYKPPGWNVKLGGGRNLSDEKTTRPTS